MNALTDDTGMLQHAIFTIPNRAEGYTTDDNARALIFTVLLEQLGSRANQSVSRTIGSRQSGLGISVIWRFSSMPSIPRREGSETSSATTVAGWKSRDRKILTAAHCGPWELSWADPQIQGLRGAAGRLVRVLAVPAVVEFHSPRACAYALLGIQEYLHSYPGDRDAQRVRSALAQRLLEMYESIHRPDWKWFEDVVAYGNARLPQAMLLVGSACGDERMLSAGLDSLDWLMETQRCPTNGHFVPIGSQGFYRQGGEQARFDQQPVEAAGAVSACLEAYRVTGDHRWRNAPGRLSTGSWAITISSFRFTILKPAVAGTVCIPTAPIRIRERNPRCLS